MLVVPVEFSFEVSCFAFGNTVEFVAPNVVKYRPRAWGPYCQREMTKYQPTPDEWTEFRATVDRLGVWQWKNNYDVPDICDGASWHLTLRYDDREIVTGGSSGFPDCHGNIERISGNKAVFNALCDAASVIAGGRNLFSEPPLMDLDFLD